MKKKKKDRPDHKTKMPRSITHAIYEVGTDKNKMSRKNDTFSMQNIHHYEIVKISLSMCFWSVPTAS